MERLSVIDRVEAARHAVREGAVPVKAVYGDGVHVVNEWKLVNEGTPPCIKVLDLGLYGCKKDWSPVFTSFPDADSTLTAAVLLGIVPSNQWMMYQIAEQVAELDLDPMGRDITLGSEGSILMVWNFLMKENRTTNLSHLFQFGVGLWSSLTWMSRRSIADLAQPFKKKQRELETLAYKDFFTRGVKEGRVLLIDGSRISGFSKWYGRVPRSGGPSELEGWKDPFVIAHEAETGAVVLGCPNKDIAEILFGGFQNLFKVLYSKDDFKGWWRDDGAMGGSPHGVSVSSKNVSRLVAIANTLMETHKEGVD